MTSHPSSPVLQAVIDELRTQGIQTTIHYPPVHQMTFYRERYPGVALPRTEDFAQRELTIPLHPQITSPVAEAVVAALASALNGDAQTGTAA